MFPEPGSTLGSGIGPHMGLGHTTVKAAMKARDDDTLEGAHSFVAHF